MHASNNSRCRVSRDAPDSITRDPDAETDAVEAAPDRLASLKKIVLEEAE
jgi:hypothetical protein